MQKIPVTRDGQAHSGVIIDAGEILKIESAGGRKFVFHTRQEQFSLDLSLEGMERWLFEEGFRLLDADTLVNMNHVTEYDPGKGVVFFENPANRQGKTARTARSQRAHIQLMLEAMRAGRANETPPAVRAEHPLTLPEGSSPGDEIVYPAARAGEEHDFSRSVATIRAVNDRRLAETRLAYFSKHDVLTGLPNRTLFQDRLADCIASSSDGSHMMAVLLLDFDRFKTINATLGHSIGDKLLQEVAIRLFESLPGNPFAARFGGDEFLILLPNVGHIEQVSDFARSLTSLLREPVHIEGHAIYLTASVGTSIYPNDGIDPDALIKHAEVAMYRAKNKGGNNFHLYHPELNRRSIELLHMETELRAALAEEQFTLHYQPLINLTTGTIYGMESLIRWEHPSRGSLLPDQFIPFAEEIGLIAPIGGWVLQQACKQTREWQSIGYPSITVTVNVSISQLQQPGFVAFVKETLEETGLAPHFLCLEMTESAVMKNVALLSDTLSRLRQLGVQLSIDNFGTGTCSIADLKRFRVQLLKLDKSLLLELTADGDNAAIVSALVAMSQRLQMRTVVKCVETEEQARLLQSLGCEEMQGHLFSTPLPPDEVVLYLENAISLDPGSQSFG